MFIKPYVKNDTQEIIRLELSRWSSGKITLSAVTKDGKGIKDGELLTITDYGTIELNTDVNPELGFLLDHNGKIQIDSFCGTKSKSRLWDLEKRLKSESVVKELKLSLIEEILAIAYLSTKFVEKDNSFLQDAKQLIDKKELSVEEIVEAFELGLKRELEALKNKENE